MAFTALDPWLCVIAFRRFCLFVVHIDKLFYILYTWHDAVKQRVVASRTREEVGV